MRNPEAINPITLPNRKRSCQTADEEQQARQEAAEAQLNSWRAFLPGILEKFCRIKDPRRPGSVRHKPTTLMVSGMLLFVFQCASRRQANRELSCPGFLEVLRSAFPELDSISHLDTLERLLEEVPAETIEDVLGKTIRKLLRSKKLQALMVEKCYVVAIDGAHKFTRTIPFADEALQRQSGGETTPTARSLPGKTSSRCPEQASI